MDRATFFITYNGKRYYWTDIERERPRSEQWKRTAMWAGIVAVLCGGLFIKLSTHGGPPSALASLFATGSLLMTVLAFGALLAWGLLEPPTEQWEREWTYYEADKASVKAKAPGAGSLAIQQPHGVRDDDDING